MSELISLQNSPDLILQDQLVPPPPSIGYAAVVDSSYMDTPFLPDFPQNLVENGAVNKDVDVIIGTTTEDGLVASQVKQ